MKCPVELDARTMFVTPGMASQWLERNTSNRPLNERYVARYRGEIREWVLNGDTIKIVGRWTAAGEVQCDLLVDGQHRLTAGVLERVGFWSLIVVGVDRSVFDSLDNGKTRSPGDVLAIAGVKYGTSMAAALRLVKSYESGLDSGMLELTNKQIKDSVPGYPRLLGSIELVASVGGCRKLVEPSVMHACHYLFALKDEIYADEFVRSLLTGENLSADSSIYKLRERLVRSRADRKGKLRKVYAMALVIKAWNAFRSNRGRQIISYRNQGERAESFPVVL